VETALAPDSMLGLLQRIEAEFGRRRRGQRWGARVLDLDIVLWDGGGFSTPHLTIPHRHFRVRKFVLGPARRIAGPWRDPLTGLTVHQLFSRLTRPAPFQN
jgi:2-amino-4-hydroxy-6-hydroxymethyldihydropteridine diphosphokinase